MNVKLIALGVISAVFAVIEYIHHDSYHKKHPDYEKCGSGIIGYILLAIALVWWGV